MLGDWAKLETQTLKFRFETASVRRRIVMPVSLSTRQIELIDAYWRACNYLAVGMIYLRDNPLLREPLLPEHIKSRLLGHWGSDPGQTFIWVHLNRLIRKYDLDMIYISGPGHGAPGGARELLSGRRLFRNLSR